MKVFNLFKHVEKMAIVIMYELLISQHGCQRFSSWNMLRQVEKREMGHSLYIGPMFNDITN